MGAKTSIQWSDATWSPLRVRVRSNAADIARSKNYTSLIQIGEKMAGRVGQHCEHVSDGCVHCYSGTWQGRCLTSGGTGLPFDRRSRDLVEPFVDEKSLGDPLRWKTPKKIFVENQSDLFGEWYRDEMIDRVFAVMALAPQHVFQVLTKRPERMQKYFHNASDLRDRISAMLVDPRFLDNWGNPRKLILGNPSRAGVAEGIRKGWRSPLPEWVWLGVSVEDQKTADARTFYLRQIPAAVRFISQEPQLSRIEWTNDMLHGISWLIVGGESGPGARPFDVQWARDTVAQCRKSGTACFVKQLGAKPHEHRPNGDHVFFDFKDRKGGSMEEWPDSIPRVRQFPGEQPIIPAAEHRSDEWHEPEPEK